MKNFLAIINSVSCVQQSYDYIITLSDVCIFHKDAVYRLKRRNNIMIKVWGRILCVSSHTDSAEVTRLLTTSVPRLLDRKQIRHLSLWRDNPACLTWLVPLVPICEHKDLAYFYPFSSGRKEDWQWGIRKSGRTELITKVKSFRDYMPCYHKFSSHF